MIATLQQMIQGRTRRSPRESDVCTMLAVAILALNDLDVFLVLTDSVI